MKYLKSISLVVFALLAGVSMASESPLPEGFPETNRQKHVLVDGWEFYLDETSTGAIETVLATDQWQAVTIPHTPKLSSLDLNGCEDDHYQLTFHRWVAWYKRDLTASYKDGEKVYLEFEGAHQITKCWVNGVYVGEHAIGGYTPFHFDITEFVKPSGEANHIVLSVDNRPNADVPPDGDRYDYIKWSGLYRDVYLVVKDPLHIGFPWEDKASGVFVSTPSVSAENATVSVRTTVVNESADAKNCRLLTSVIDDKGIVVLALEDEQTIPANGDFTFQQTGGIIEDVKLWSIESPYLYRVNTIVYDGDETVDVVENPLGLRKFEFVDGRGFLLNGKEVELIGANKHQANLYIGDAVPNGMFWKDAYQFKQAGFNSVRLAHYPHDDAFLQACDELGILVYEEPPTWIGIGGEKWFDNLEEATRRMVRNHRNHPSVLMWGAALNHRGPVERLHYACKDEDPTRHTGSNGAPWTAQRHSGIADIYTPMDYQNMPITANEFTYLCEHGGSTDARRAQFEVSKTRQMANMIGVALWTAHDYQSFKGFQHLSTRRPWNQYRVANPPVYWYQSETTETPMVYICDERVTTDEQVMVFSNCQRVDLYHDGKLVASQTPDREATLLYLEHPTYTFNYEWTNGELVAKGYNGGQMVAETRLAKPGVAKRLRVEIETDDIEFFANGSDIKWVRAWIEDENGNIVRENETMVEFSIEGDAEIIGDESIGANPVASFWGVASAMVRAGDTVGEITVTAKANGLKSDEATVETVAFETNRILAEAKPIYRFKSDNIDLSSGVESAEAGNDGLFEIGAVSKGAKVEFLQFDWNAWAGDVESESVYESSSLDGAEFHLKSEGGELDWFAHWGMMSELPYVAIDGVKVAADAKMILEVTGLKKGTYEFTTWHHQMESVNRAPASLQIVLSDAKANERVVEKGLRLTSGANIYTRYPASATFEVVSNGKDSVVIEFSGISDRLDVVLNGISVKETF